MSENILITGASSRVGKYLTLNLLEKTEARLWIFIRKLPNARNIEKRFWSIFQNEIPPDLFQRRIRLISGDLSKRSLGISDHDFMDLEKSGIDEIFHLASFTDRANFSKDSLFAVNYHGTERLLSLSRRLRTRNFNYLGSLYAAYRLQDHQGNYLDFFDSHSDFHNLNEFVHRMTMGLVARECSQHKIGYRIINPAYMIDPEIEPQIKGSWYSYVMEPILRLAYIHSRDRSPLVLPASANQSLALTTPRFIADLISALHSEAENSTSQIYNAFTEKRMVRDLLKMIASESPGLELKFVESLDALPWMERKLFKKALLFFEYFVTDLHFEHDPKVLGLVEKHKIPAASISDAYFNRIVRTFQNLGQSHISREDRITSTLIRAKILMNRLGRRKAA